jgi:predicted amino acid dehydrogenase
MQATVEQPRLGITCLDEWSREREAAALDVILLTHPRNDADLIRLFPWSEPFSAEYRRALLKHLRPMMGEVIESPRLNAGLLFATCLAEDMIRPETRGGCREMLAREALPALRRTGARYVCLGGLTASLTGYGRRLQEPAEALGLTVTTGHSATVVSVYRTYVRACRELGLRPAEGRMVVLGLGSVGSGFVRLLLQQPELPESLVLIDRPSRRPQLDELAEELRGMSGVDIRIETSAPDGRIAADSACYDCRFLISAISSWDIIDIALVKPGTVLVDDSQPNCWSREHAWQRCRERLDIAPCEAGLIDCSSIGYRSHFPFGFADHGDWGSRTAWCCLTEGMMLALVPGLAPTIGEPTAEGVLRFDQAFDRLGLEAASLQCEGRLLPVAQLREAFALTA